MWHLHIHRQRCTNQSCHMAFESYLSKFNGFSPAVSAVLLLGNSRTPEVSWAKAMPARLIHAFLPGPGRFITSEENMVTHAACTSLFSLLNMRSSLLLCFLNGMSGRACNDMIHSALSVDILRQGTDVSQTRQP